MQFRDKQIAPPKDWGAFENLCHALFKRVWNSPYAQKNGRRGQKQHGVDIFGTLHSVGNVFHGVQCKGKDATYGGKPTLEELKEEIEKADTFSPRLEHWIFATTAPADATIQQAAREISVERKANGFFTLDVLGWEEIQALMADVPQVIEEFYPEHAANLPAVLETLRALPSYGQMLALVQRVEALGAKLGVSLPSPRSDAVWLPVEFENGRDLGPALMGRPLGPADAAACPRLVEADIVLAHLKSAYSVQIVGEPGAGKSVCAYQASMTLAGRGFDVLRLTNPQSDQVRFEKSAQQRPRLFLIDNAHLMSPHVLKALEDDATGERLGSVRTRGGNSEPVKV